MKVSPTLIVLLALFLLWLAYFHKILFFGHLFYIGDNNSVNLPYMTFFTANLKKGIFPLWNPYILCGTHFFCGYACFLPHSLDFFYFQS